MSWFNSDILWFINSILKTYNIANEKSSGFSCANHVGIAVSNLENSIAFYEALTGVKVSNIDEIGGPRFAQAQGLDGTLIKYANLHLDNLNMDILEYVVPKPEKASYQNN